MNYKYGYLVNRGNKSLKDFLKYTIRNVMNDLASFESKGLERHLVEPDRIVTAISINDRYKELLEIIAPKELEVIEIIRYSKHIENEEEFYIVRALLLAKYELLFIDRNIYIETLIK